MHLYLHLIIRSQLSGIIVPPQQMLNSPTLRQYYVNQCLHLLRVKFTNSLIIHYMDNILFSTSKKEYLQKVFKASKQILVDFGLQVATEKVQFPISKVIFFKIIILFLRRSISVGISSAPPLLFKRFQGIFIGYILP